MLLLICSSSRISSFFLFTFPTQIYVQMFTCTCLFKQFSISILHCYFKYFVFIKLKSNCLFLTLLHSFSYQSSFPPLYLFEVLSNRPILMILFYLFSGIVGKTSSTLKADIEYFVKFLTAFALIQAALVFIVGVTRGISPEQGILLLAICQSVYLCSWLSVYVSIYLYHALTRPLYSNPTTFIIFIDFLKTFHLS